jgi:hypothetical protein
MKKYLLGFLIIGSIVSLWSFFMYAGCGQPKAHNTVVQGKAVYHCPMHPTYTSDKPGDCPICGMKLVKSEENSSEKTSEIAAETKKERKLLYYRNPMNPQATSPVFMKDSMGMDYIPVYEEESPTASGGGSTVAISPERQQMIGIKTGQVKVMNLTKVVRASGKIAYDPELVVTQEEFIQVLKAEDQTNDLANATRNKLRLLGMSEEQITALEKSRLAETSLYLPGQGENVWAYISVYEYEIAMIKAGDPVELEVAAYPGEKFFGKVTSIYPVLDPATRTNQVRVAVPNPSNKLKPEMYVNAMIKETLGSKLAVAESAVLDTGLRKIVYLVKEDNIFESREVNLGQKAGDYYEVLSGLKAGNVVVTSGNFLVDSESKLKAPSQGN